MTPAEIQSEIDALDAIRKRLKLALVTEPRFFVRDYLNAAEGFCDNASFTLSQALPHPDEKEEVAS